MPQRAFEDWRPGFSLPRELYLDDAVFADELDRIWRSSWLFAAFAAELPAPGAFVSHAVGDARILIVRDDDGALRGVHNTCRHRGMPVCEEACGSVERWVCPYHQWAYARDGALLGATGLDGAADPASLGLRRAPVEEVGGLVFAWLGDGEPAPFGPARRVLGEALALQGLDRARVAHAIDYEVRANWKLVWENNRECWHCHLGHPEYAQANFDVAPDTRRTRELAAARAADHARVLARAGAPATDEHVGPGLYAFPSPGRWWSANRTPLAPGFVTESLDGRPVAPLMGGHPDYDVGTLRVRTVPNLWCHASADHAVLTRLEPLAPGLTRARVSWLVDAGAVEGTDFELGRLLPFWRLTSEQDWDLCERNHAGVRNPAYEPGPYSPSREANVAAFSAWYVGRMTAA
jgi:Rieske 2Fe-2S family protein